jgi:hypothetical protein
MKTWQKLGLMIIPAILIAGIGIVVMQRQRNAPVRIQPKYQERALTEDETVVPRKMYIDDLASARALNGHTVWVQAGYELEYFPYAHHRVEYARQAGVLPSAQALQIQEIVTQKEPAKVATHVPAGHQQVLAVFTLPGDAKSYAVPIGYLQGSDSKYYCDDIFYYDDPHAMYPFWPADVWRAIDLHQPRPGMNELQVAMALGVMQQSDSSDYGNRTVDYDAGGNKWSVTFSGDKATSVRQD